MYAQTLPVTGSAGLIAFGHVIGLDALVGGAIAVVLLGITLYRLGSRLTGRSAGAA